MKKLILILGLVFSTAGNKAITLDSSFSQDQWQAWLVVFPVYDSGPVDGFMYLDGVKVWDVSGAAIGAYYPASYLDGWVGPSGNIAVNPFLTVGSHTLEFVWPELTLEYSYIVAAPTADYSYNYPTPAPHLPDGGATGLLLGCGFFALVGGRHLLNRRPL